MKQFTIGLIGNPNSGKTTLFNALTGLHQRIGNWPGVTVDRKSGFFELNDYHVEIVDLPGIYSLSVADQDGAIDERIAAEYLLSDSSDLIVNVLDANNLERNLYFTTQLIELNIPIVLAVNMVDIAKKRGIHVDIKKLSELFGCPAIGLVSTKKQGVNELQKIVIDTYRSRRLCKQLIVYPDEIKTTLAKLIAAISVKHSYFLAVRLLEGDVLTRKKVNPDLVGLAERQKQKISKKLHEDTDILIADARYGMIHKIIEQVVTSHIIVKTTVTAFLDRIMLNRILGIPIFLAVMYLMFMFSINIGGAFQDFFQISGNAIFVSGLAHLLSSWHFPEWLIVVLATGAGRGISTILTFIPVLGAMFLFLAILEGTGYMARAGFVVDRLMGAIGLPGKSFVPMLIGFGCNVPAILAARTLESKRDRILTVMMTPFMSCGARFAIYAVFMAAFFPKGGQNIVFILYITGILIAIFTGLILRKTVLKGRQASLIMELPPYHLPTIRNILQQTWCRLRSFVYKAGKIIVPVCLIIGILNIQMPHKRSLLEGVGRDITPVFKPMGIKKDNWPASVGLITGVMAKEVVVATLNTLYSQQLDLRAKIIEPTNLFKEMHKAVLSVPRNLANFSNSGKIVLHKEVYGQMYKQFAGPIGAFTYLLFVLLYFPCIPALAAIFHELDRRWAVFSMLWNTGIAYCVATIFYQVATFVEHPGYSISWIAGLVAAFFITVISMRRFSRGE